MAEISLNNTVYKYTNFLFGYQERYFKIDQSQISYFRSKDAESEGCRKSRALTEFNIELDEDPCRMDIVFKDDRWCLRFKSEQELDIWKNALMAFMPNMTSPPRTVGHNQVDLHKLTIMQQNMILQYDSIISFLHSFLNTSGSPVDLSAVEQTIDQCRQLEDNLKSLRSILRHLQLKESYMSDEEFFDAQDDESELDPQIIQSFREESICASEIQQPSTSALESESPLMKEILHMTAEQLRYAKAGVDDGPWELFCTDGEMKMYRRDYEVDGLMCDPLKAVHSVKGVTAREYMDIFFKPEYKLSWDHTLERVNVVEEISENIVVLHQLHKKVWPAAQRESLFWSHFYDVCSERDPDAHDAYMVCNHDCDRPDVPRVDNSSVRVGLTIAMLCQTVIEAKKPLDQLRRDDIRCRITYVAQVHPGGWVPTSALRQVYKREYPKFLRMFTKFVLEQIKGKALTL
uniref:Collagen type IV alpha-3-binding protein n=1 Tax=Acrobeloides nanus TaxID=290746 RepID=A0A914BWJ6_9BILA